MNHSLEKVGAPAKKTFKIEFPYWMPEDLKRHFIRGYFDGDGGIYRQKEKGICADITSNITFVNQLGEYLESIGIHNTISIEKNKPCIGKVHFYSKDACKKLYEYFYKDATIYLERKYKRFYEYFEEEKPIIPYYLEEK